MKGSCGQEALAGEEESVAACFRNPSTPGSRKGGEWAGYTQGATQLHPGHLAQKLSGNSKATGKQSRRPGLAEDPLHATN